LGRVLFATECYSPEIDGVSLFDCMLDYCLATELARRVLDHLDALGTVTVVHHLERHEHPLALHSAGRNRGGYEDVAGVNIPSVLPNRATAARYRRATHEGLIDPSFGARLWSEILRAQFSASINLRRLAEWLGALPSESAAP
jgi:hypothetical protein